MQMQRRPCAAFMANFFAPAKDERKTTKARRMAPGTSSWQRYASTERPLARSTRNMLSCRKFRCPKRSMEADSSMRWRAFISCKSAAEVT